MKKLTLLLLSLLIVPTATAEMTVAQKVCAKISTYSTDRQTTIKSNVEKVLLVIEKTHKYYNLLVDINKCLNPVTPVVETEYEVETVVDWDTVYILKNWKATRLRMIGIDAPESTALRYGYIEELWAEAKGKLKELIGNNKVSLEYDESQWTVDSHGRDLVYIFVGSRNINKEMIQTGYAKEYTYDKPYKYQEQFKEAERVAKDKGIWIWEKEEIIENNTYNFSETNYSGRIKGNISTKTGEKIYHIPWCASYNRTKISTHKWERYFDTEEEARNAGWRKASNC